VVDLGRFLDNDHLSNFSGNSPQQRDNDGSSSMMPSQLQANSQRSSKSSYKV